MNPYTREGRAESHLRERLRTSESWMDGHPMPVDKDAIRWAVEEIDRLRAKLDALGGKDRGDR